MPQCSNKRRIGFGLLIAGGCFLWNPVVGVVDLLPDLFGYLLICAGISKLADLNDDLAQAQKSFRAMLWVGMGQLLAALLTESVLRRTEEQLNRYEKPVWVLLFAFVFLVLEWYFLFPAWRNFFRGLSALAEFGGGTVLMRENRKGRTRCETAAKASAFFVSAHAILTLIPELAVLTSFERDAENPLFTFDWYRFADLFRFASASLSLIVGLVWLVIYLRTMAAAQRDTAWRACLQDRYASEILPDTGLLLNRRVGASFAFFRVGAFFLINLSLSHYEFLPDWCGAVLFFCGWLMLGILMERRVDFIFCGSVLLCIGIFRTGANIFYLKDYVPQDALRLPAAYEKYRIIQLLGVAEALVALMLAVLVIRALLQMADRHVFVRYQKNDNEVSDRATARLHYRLKQKAIPVYVFLALSASGKIAEICLQQMHGWIWTLQFLISFIAAVIFSSFLTALSEQISETYPKKRIA